MPPPETKKHDRPAKPGKCMADLVKQPLLSGIRYPDGTTLWSTFHSGQAAWTRDPRLAARHYSPLSAILAASTLVGDHATPFCEPAPLCTPPAGTSAG